jgi:uroporphyrinogen-III synthase
MSPPTRVDGRSGRRLAPRRGPRVGLTVAITADRRRGEFAAPLEAAGPAALAPALLIGATAAGGGLVDRRRADPVRRPPTVAVSCTARPASWRPAAAGGVGARYGLPPRSGTGYLIPWAARPGGAVAVSWLTTGRRVRVVPGGAGPLRERGVAGERRGLLRAATTSPDFAGDALRAAGAVVVDAPSPAGCRRPPGATAPPSST